MLSRMKSGLGFVVVVLLGVLSGPAQAVDESNAWIKISEGFWMRDPGTVPKSDGGAVSVEALKFDRLDYSYELILLEELFAERYPQQDREGVVFDPVTETSRLLQPSVAEAWAILSDDPTIVALIPVGFSASAGEAAIVGLLKRDGEISQGIFAAPNLDTALCLNDEFWRGTLNVDNPYKDADLPYIMPIRYAQKANYRYMSNLDALDLSFGRNAIRFEMCKAVIQVGYRVIELDVPGDDDAPGRLSHGPTSMEVLRAFSRIVMLYDGNGHLHFIQVQEPAHLFDVGRYLSSDAYFGDVECRYPKRNIDFQGRDLGSQSCEIWATSVSAFEGASILLRRSFVEPEGNSEDPIVWGNIDSATPAVLALRPTGVRAPASAGEPNLAPPSIGLPTAPPLVPGSQPAPTQNTSP